MEDFIYWRHPTPPGIKVEEISGGDHYKGELWLQMAKQLYCENGRDSYREIGHYADGAPFLYGEAGRISISHTPGLLAVATLPPTPEVDLEKWSERACVGIDVENKDRKQVLKVRERYLSEPEIETIAQDDLQTHVIAWTLKEAAYKAMRIPGLDFRKDIHISKMPKIAPPTPVFKPSDFGLPADKTKLPDEFYGEVEIRTQDGIKKLKAFTYLSDDFVVSLVYAPECAKFGGNKF